VLAGVLAAAAAAGWGIGTWLGSQGAGPEPAAGPSTQPSQGAPATPARPGTPQQLVLTVSGSGDDISAPFEVVGRWQIQWRTDGESLAIAVTGDPILGLVVDEPGPASGATSFVQGGTFRLEVTAEGPWTITVLQSEG
jgi:hypothetical protein